MQMVSRKAVEVRDNPRVGLRGDVSQDVLGKMEVAQSGGETRQVPVVFVIR